MAAQSSVQVKLKNSHLQREKLGQLLGRPRATEPMEKVQRCQTKGVFKPQRLVPIPQLTLLSSHARTPLYLP